jgi:TatA/E family protein of Tat protein translocase
VLSLSPLKLAVVLIVALVLVGPDKLPGLARQMGAAWKAFRSFSTRIEDDVRANLPDLPSTGDIARMARSPVALLDSLAKFDDEQLEPDPGATATPNEDDHLQPDPGAPSTAPPAGTATGPDLTATTPTTTPTVAPPTPRPAPAPSAEGTAPPAADPSLN